MIDLSCWEVFVFLGVLVGMVLWYLVVSGLLARVHVNTSETKYGPMVIAYKSRIGPYKGAGDLFKDCYCLLPNREQIGLYYDDPESVPAPELRCAVGPILSNGEELPNREEMELMRSHGFKIFHVPKANFVVSAVFPFRTSFSILIAISRVYPKLRQYIAQRNLCAYPAIEIYTDREIWFIMPLSKQEEYFVQEFQEEDISVATTDVGSVIGDTAPKDEDLFLKPRTPVRVNNIRSSRDLLDISADDPSEEEEEAEANDNRGDSEDEASAATNSSFDDLETELGEGMKT